MCCRSPSLLHPLAQPRCLPSLLQTHQRLTRKSHFGAVIVPSRHPPLELNTCSLSITAVRSSTSTFLRADLPVSRSPIFVRDDRRRQLPLLAPRRPQANDTCQGWDGDSQPPDDPFSPLRRPLEKRLPRESGPGAPRRGARPPGTGETPSPPGSRGTRSARGGPGKRPAPRADDSTARRTRDYGRARAPP